jgi:rhodanese-related sulfurtransferase
VPLFMIRKKAKALGTGEHLIAACDDGGRSTAAAFLLAERGVEVSVLKDGLGARST